MTFPGAYALMATAYLERFAIGVEALAHVAVENHAHAASNELAQYRTRIPVDDVLGASTVPEPLGLYDACPLTDGVSALVLASDYSRYSNVGRHANADAVPDATTGVAHNAGGTVASAVVTV